MITLDDVFIKPENADQFATPPWTGNDIRRGVRQALYNMVTYGYYAPYLDNFPVMFEDEFSKSTKDHVEEVDTFATTEGSKIYIESNRAAKFMNECMSDYGNTDNIAQECAAFLSHEYTHILCEHHAIGEALARRYNDKVPSGVWTCHMLACEIQANRGSEVKKNTFVYRRGVTEDSFPETKGVYTYNEIFAILLKQFNKERKKMSQLAKQIVDMMTRDVKRKNGGGSKDKNGSGDGKKKQETIESKLTDEEIKEALNKAKDAEQEVYEELSQYGGGYGLEKGDDNKLQLRPDSKLKTEHKRWDEQRIKNELKRMKGYVRGSFAKERSKSYSRPSRRNIDPSSSLLRKGIKSTNKTMPRVLVAMDSSGSMGGTPVTVVATAIGNLFKDLGRPMDGCYIVKHDTRCSDPEPLRNWERVVESFRPCGGNCFNNVVKLANELKVDVVFNIGDGCDSCIRNYDNQDKLDGACKEFVINNRTWVDTLIVNKSENSYFDSEYTFDEKRGFARDILQLGAKIEEYL